MSRGARVRGEEITDVITSEFISGLVETTVAASRGSPGCRGRGGGGGEAEEAGTLSVGWEERGGAISGRGGRSCTGLGRCCSILGGSCCRLVPPAGPASMLSKNTHKVGGSGRQKKEAVEG